MNVGLLIDAVMRQTMVLIAELATSGGLRAPLAHVASEAFLELSRELESQGVTKKVSADMFGMALRTYQRRTQRLSQSRTDRGRSLWEAVLEFVQQNDGASRSEIFRRFRHDDEPSVRGVLRDLTESGLVYTTGGGRATSYRAATSEELGRHDARTDRVALEAVLWSFVYRDGPLEAGRLAALCKLPEESVLPVLADLVQAGRVERVETRGTASYRSRELVLGFDDPAGWEASVLDHFSTMVRTIGKKLARDQRASAADEDGGSTYHFDLWRGHPLESEVVGELARFRQRMTALRERVDRVNAERGESSRTLRVDCYYGQSVTEETADEAEPDDET
jgi:hypothetical protein